MSRNVTGFLIKTTTLYVVVKISIKLNFQRFLLAVFYWLLLMKSALFLQYHHLCVSYQLRYRQDDISKMTALKCLVFMTLFINIIKRVP